MLLSIGEELWYKGFYEGFSEGFIRSFTEFRAETLLLQLGERFGKIPASIRSRVRSASHVQIDDWRWAALRARDLDEVFSRPAVG